MATATSIAPTREDFAALLEESFTSGSPQEGQVVKGIIVQRPKGALRSVNFPAPAGRTN